MKSFVSGFDCSIHVGYRSHFHLTNHRFVMRIDGFRLFARGRVAEFAIDKQLIGKTNVHFVDMHPDRLKIQILQQKMKVVNTQRNVFHGFVSLVNLSADTVISQGFDIFIDELSLFSTQLRYFDFVKSIGLKKRLNSTGKMSKICKILLSADVFTTHQNVGRQCDFVNF